MSSSATGASDPRTRPRPVWSDLLRAARHGPSRAVAIGDPAVIPALLASAPFTMVDARRRIDLWRLLRSAIARGIPGDVVELGTYRGGTAAVLAAALLRASAGRSLWLFDSFQGLPETTANDEGEWHGGRRWHADPKKAARRRGGAGLGRLIASDIDRASAMDVHAALAAVGYDPVRAHVIPGWFQETLARRASAPIALLHLDADWYESTKLGLETFYDQISPGGYVVLDDYGTWIGCARATDEFRARRGIRAPLHAWGDEQVYWEKE